MKLSEKQLIKLIKEAIDKNMQMTRDWENYGNGNVWDRRRHKANPKAEEILKNDKGLGYYNPLSMEGNYGDDKY